MLASRLPHRVKGRLAPSSVYSTMLLYHPYWLPLGGLPSNRSPLSATISTGEKVVLELHITRMKTIFSPCSAAFKVSTSREEKTRKQESEGLVRNLHHVTGATPALRRGSESFARIAESIPYHHQSTNAKRCSPCSDALEGTRVAVAMLMCPSIH